MDKNTLIRKCLVLGIIILFVGSNFLPSISGNIKKINEVNSYLVNTGHNSIIDNGILDLSFIYNITENLSNIIFTEYNESSGEIAKGRAFGTKGEWRSAEILYENMSNMGLYTWNESIQNIPECPYVASKLETLAKGLTVYNKSSQTKLSVADCYISPKWNFTGLSLYLPDFLQDLQRRRPILGSIAAILIPLLLPRPDGFLDRRYNFYVGERLTHNFSYTNLKVIRKPTTYSLAEDLIRQFINNEPFVYIGKDQGFTLWPDEEVDFRGALYNILLKLINSLGYGKISDDLFENILWARFHPNCRGIILYDSDNYTYNMNIHIGYPLPIIYVNRTVGEKINESPENYNINFYINQRWNESVESYNVIGQLNGTDPSKTVIVDCLYDSWWCQGTADAAIGMAIVLGIAKYFRDHNITPKYNIKFIGFCGEEAGGIRGATYYEAVPPPDEENLVTIIDLNQVGFKQPYPPLELLIATNNGSVNVTVKKIADETHYLERIEDVADLKTLWVNRTYGGNYLPFAKNHSYWDRSSTNWIYIVKDTGWILHHHDGMKHTKGDVLDYYYPDDVNATSEMIWNITKYFAVNPDCWFENESFTAFDSPDDEDDLNDSIKATFTIKTTLPSDRVMVNASLTKAESGVVVANKMVNYTVTTIGIEDSITLTVPEHEEAGWYTCTFLLYNSTGRINEILHLKDNNVNDTSPSQPRNYYLYPYG